MMLLDVNILVYAFREDSPEHARYQSWLSLVVNGEEPFGLSGGVLSGFLRIVTHPRVFKPPTPIDVAFQFVEVILNSANCVLISPGPNHWKIFTDLCLDTQATGNQIPDAYLAALAIKSSCEWITADRGFGRYQGLKWRNPMGTTR